MSIVCEKWTSILNKPPSKCPSANAIGGTLLLAGCKCTWPVFRCPHTPDWQLFSACIHPDDSMVAIMWHQLRKPFRVPFGMPGHLCTWEQIDHHLAGCTICGIVHRCDTDQCEEILQGERGFSDMLCMQQKGIRCPTHQTDDGSIVCLITGVCIRTRSYGLEYELVSRQGLSSKAMGESNARPNITNTPDAKKRKRVQLPSERQPPFQIHLGIMKNDFHEQNLSSWIKRLISMVVQVLISMYPRNSDLNQVHLASKSYPYTRHQNRIPTLGIKIVSLHLASKSYPYTRHQTSYPYIIFQPNTVLTAYGAGSQGPLFKIQ